MTETHEVPLELPQLRPLPGHAQEHVDIVPITGLTARHVLALLGRPLGRVEAWPELSVSRTALDSRSILEATLHLPPGSSPADGVRVEVACRAAGREIQRVALAPAVAPSLLSGVGVMEPLDEPTYALLVTIP
jgi:hypothetical protein